MHGFSNYPRHHELVDVRYVKRQNGRTFARLLRYAFAFVLLGEKFGMGLAHVVEEVNGVVLKFLFQPAAHLGRLLVDVAHLPALLGLLILITWLLHSASTQSVRSSAVSLKVTVTSLFRGH